MKKIIAYIGTYTNHGSKGIYKLTANPGSGELEDIILVAEIDHAPYLNITKNNKYLYAIGQEGNQGGVAAFEIQESGDLVLINKELSDGPAPSHINTNLEGSYLFSANYERGTVSAYPLKENGAIESPTSIAQHKGSGPNKDRQESSHVHYVTLTPDHKYLCAIDLGIDEMILYTLSKDGLLSQNSVLSFTPGSGPRHMDFHPNGKIAYILTELSSEVVVLEYENGHFNKVQTLSTLPENYTDFNLGSAIHISPNGRFLYTSNRGHNSIALFAIDESTGHLRFQTHIPTQGEIPRDFNIDPSGQFLFVAHQGSNNIYAFSIDSETGYLTFLNSSVTVTNPVCIKFLNT
jgi:6-phosphogluconolactonase